MTSEKIFYERIIYSEIFTKKSTKGFEKTVEINKRTFPCNRTSFRL